MQPLQLEAAIRPHHEDQSPLSLSERLRGVMAAHRRFAAILPLCATLLLLLAFGQRGARARSLHQQPAAAAGAVRGPCFRTGWRAAGGQQHTRHAASAAARRLSPPASHSC